ncbi:hypothetical protein AGOR_G00016440 [Albula goreensis]|uniref:Poly [ADP-ribose] polymerase 12 n=1 Tax=Albula goreensis TaxID=1534307 RepID=A0A8T3E820_9TELE|nr:hypothetical protein AGOR_G00016440 [Albula goreensis]
MSAVANFITRVLCEHQGCLDFRQLSQTLRQSITAPDSMIVDILRENTNKFVIVEGKEKRVTNSPLSADSLVIAKTSLRVCQTPPDSCDTCPNLHLCRYFVCGKCRFGIKCKNSHDLCSPHNVQVLRTQGLQELTPPALFQLLLQNDSYLLPEICSHYNRGNGEHGSCRFTDRCTSLHVCQHFLQDDCKFGAMCKRAHKFDAAAMKILNGRGISPENLRVLQSIYRIRFTISGHADGPAVPGLSTRKKETEFTGIPAAPPAVPVVKERSRQRSSTSISEADSNEICLFFIRRGCSFKEKCVRVHYHLPYKWQIVDRDGTTWKDLPDMESVEQAYCNPAKNSSDGISQVDFLSMTSGSSKVRRLSTASSVTKPPHFILTTDWLWYWKNDEGAWSEFGTEADAKAKCVHHITNPGECTYTLSFKDMFQQNIKYKTKREIRRRPRFVSGQDVEKKLKSGTSEASGSSTMSIPAHWDKEALPDFNYKLIPLSDSSTEFQQVAQLFKRTLSQSTIRSIQRIQNPSLHRVFQWQKEQMQGRNGGKSVEQKLLFHGTDKSFMPAICEQNFDWRICGTNGTLYGKGKHQPITEATLPLPGIQRQSQSPPSTLKIPKSSEAQRFL